MKKGVLHSL